MTTVKLKVTGSLAELSCQVEGRKEKKVYEAAEQGTRNKTTLSAMITALEHMTRRSKLIIQTDNSHVTGALLQGWPARWQQDGWKKADGMQIANRSQWVYLMELLGKHIYEVIEDEKTVGSTVQKRSKDDHNP